MYIEFRTVKLKKQCESFEKGRAAWGEQGRAKGGPAHRRTQGGLFHRRPQPSSSFALPCTERV